MAVFYLHQSGRKRPDLSNLIIGNVAVFLIPDGSDLYEHHV